MNNVTLIGRLGQDIEIKRTDKWNVGKFSLAVQDGRDKTYWIECEAWNKTAETIEKFSGKGLRIAVNGKLVQDSWVNDEGQNRSKLKVNVFNVDILDWKNNDNQVGEENSSDAEEDDYGMENYNPTDKRIPF